MVTARDPLARPSPAKTASAKSSAADGFTTDIRRLDWILLGGVVVVGFVLALFTARNSDLWMHLASGRALAQGEYSFGKDPFSYTTMENSYWTNHSWLYDWVLYVLNRISGSDQEAGWLLVPVKALLVSLLAWIMLSIRRKGQSLWLPVICVGLSVLAMSPRLLLQPMVVSLLFLGITLWVLAREGKKAGKPAEGMLALLFSSSPLRLYLLLPLFVLWVNLDRWFWLGPLTVGLYWLGEFLQRTFTRIETTDDAPDENESRTLGIVCAAGWLVCLFNPHHYHVFTLPPELWPGKEMLTLQKDRLFEEIFLSPLAPGYFEQRIGLNVAGMAYFPLVVLGLISFALNSGFVWRAIVWLFFLGEGRLTNDSWRWWRALVWGLFFLISIYHARFIPFFAVVAGPIAALNLQDFAARYSLGLAQSRLGKAWAMGGRLLTLLTIIGLLVAAWPGWLHAHPGHPYLARRVAWNVEVDPSLRKAGQQLSAWRKQGLLPAESRGFNFSPDAACYFAWFCPEEKSFFDYRYPLFLQVTGTYTEVRKAIHPESAVSKEGDPKPEVLRRPEMLAQRAGVWQKAFRDRHINYLVLKDPNPFLTLENVYRFLSDDKQWTLIYMDGRTTIFGWSDPLKPSKQFEKLRLDLNERAFGPKPDVAPPASRPPIPPHWLVRYREGLPHRSLDSDEVLMDLLYFDCLANRMQQERLVRSSATSATFVAMGVGPRLNLTSLMIATLDEKLAGEAFPMLADQDYGPPGAPLLALRAARRGIAANPDEPEMYLRYWAACKALWDKQEDRWARVPPSSSPGARKVWTDLQQMLQNRYIDPRYFSPWLDYKISPRRFLREVQVAAALKHALALRPDSEELHDHLARLFGQMSYFDLSLEHTQQVVRLTEERGPQLRETGPQFEERVANMKKGIRVLENDVDALYLLWESECRRWNLSKLQQAKLALYPFGLPGRALKLMQELDSSALEKDQRDLLDYLWLLVSTGQVDELRQLLSDNADNWKKRLGGQYYWYGAVLAAADGDYDQAEENLRELQVKAIPEAATCLADVLQILTFGKLELNPLPRCALVAEPRILAQDRKGYEMTAAVRKQGELLVLRGIVALEQGNVKSKVRAEECFREALKATDPVRFESRPIAVRYLKLLEEQKKQQR